jgi:hypothetical protein
MSDDWILTPLPGDTIGAKFKRRLRGEEQGRAVISVIKHFKILPNQFAD